jgi:hypothetical protein
MSKPYIIGSLLRHSRKTIQMILPEWHNFTVARRSPFRMELAIVYGREMSLNENQNRFLIG